MPAERNHLIDVARIASVLVVVVFHCYLYRLQVVDGQLRVVPWAPDHLWWVVSWLAMIMPLFFVAGGYAVAAGTDRLALGPSGYARYLAERGRRLIGPLVLFLGVTTVLWTGAAWLWQPGRSIELSRQFAQLLWFIASYLVITGLAPLLVRLHDRWRGLELVPLIVAAAAVDAWSFRVGQPDLRYLNLLTVWPLCHQLGVGLQRGWFRLGPSGLAWAGVALTAVVIPILIFGLGYPASSVGLADLPIANVQPPTVAMAVLGLGQTAVLGLLIRAGVLAVLSGAAERFVRTAGALLVTTYLWHIPCIVVAGGLLFGVTRLAPGSAAVLLSQPVVALVTVLLIGALLPLVGRLELRLIPPIGARLELRRTAVAYAVLCAGVAGVWLQGNVLHPDAPGSALALAVTFGGAWLMARAAGSRNVA